MRRVGLIKASPPGSRLVVLIACQSQQEDSEEQTRMPEQGRDLVYEFEGWELDLARRELRAHGVPVPLGSRAFQIFAVLVQSAGELVTKDELMARVWPGAIVEENKLQVHISAVRKALGSDRGTVKTSFGRGYRFVGNWTIRKESTPADSVVRVPVQAFLTNVPVAGSQPIGRASAVQHVQEFLSTYRAITLTGAGGIGKTALALDVARNLLPAFHGDCWLVDLASLSDPGLVPSAVAGVLGLKLGGDEISPESVARAIGGKKLLLVLDNCEHVIDAAARVAETVKRLCSATSIVATSREVLRIEGEHVYRVPPLDVPSEHQKESEIVLGHSAVQLLIARTRALDSAFSPHGENLRAIAAICRRLDGIPLAIEFAAARIAVLGPELVLSRLNERFGLLTRGRRTALPRHQTLRATLDWSYDLLPGPERCLLRRLGIFSAGFTLEAANAVMSGQGCTPSLVLDEISNLVAKSLVAVDGSAPSGRWRLLETTRAYALEKLAQSGETEQVARRCAEFFRDLVSPAIHSSQEPPTAEDMARYGREIDNVRAALDWSFSSVGDAAIGVVLTAAYAPVWLDLSLVVECREQIERALDRLEPGSNSSASLVMQLHISLGIALIYTMGSSERMRMILAKGLEAAESLDDVGAQLETLRALVGIHHRSGECRAAQSAAERFSRVALRTGDPALALIADRLTGNSLHYAGKQREAQRCFERVLGLYVTPEKQRHTIWTRYDQRLMARAMLAPVLWLRGFVDQGVTQAQASLEEAHATDHKLTLCWVLHYAVYPVALMTGDLVAARQAVAMLMDLATNLNAPFWKILAHCLEAKLLIRCGEFETGSVLLRTALDTCERTGWTICYPEFLGALAEGLAGLGQFTEALATIERALARAERGGESWLVAELLRIKGELLLHGAGDQSISAAERCFPAAIEVAKEQGALSWELRSTLSFARLRIRQDRPDDARQLLAPVYNRFTEGFETPDLRAASAMLQSPPSRPAKFAI
jgi:predicted ATPase/DNA-binding winged helix-turn-helix (wHTH) protein